MSKSTDIFFDLINVWVKQNQLYSIQGKVKSIDNRTCTVVPNNGGADFLNVSLEADYEGTTGKGFIVVPVVGSNVIISFKNKDFGFISAYTEIDTITSLQNNFTFNEGNNEGLVKVLELTGKLNDLESKINDLILFINTHLHTSTTPTTPTTPPTPSYTGGILPITNKKDLENNLVRH